MSKTNMELEQLVKDINKCCAKIAERDEIELPKVGGYIKKDNGFWDFIEGEGEYKKIDGDWQWCLNLD